MATRFWSLHHNDAGVSPYQAVIYNDLINLIELFEVHPDVAQHLQRGRNDSTLNENPIEDDASFMDMAEGLQEEELRERRQREIEQMFEGRPDGPNEWFWNQEE